MVTYFLLRSTSMSRDRAAHCRGCWLTFRTDLSKRATSSALPVEQDLQEPMKEVLKTATPASDLGYLLRYHGRDEAAKRRFMAQEGIPWVVQALVLLPACRREERKARLGHARAAVAAAENRGFTAQSCARSLNPDVSMPTAHCSCYSGLTLATPSFVAPFHSGAG